MGIWSFVSFIAFAVACFKCRRCNGSLNSDTIIYGTSAASFSYLDLVVFVMTCRRSVTSLNGCLYIEMKLLDTPTSYGLN